MPASDRSPTSEVLRVLRGLAEQATSSAQLFAEEMAKATERAPEPLVRLGAQIAQLSTMWVAPVQATLKQQREFLELMASWAASQRDFAERMAKMAEDNLRVSEQLTGLLAPLLEQVEEVRDRATARTRRPRSS